MNASRTRLNDALQSIGGEVLTDNAVFSQTIVNSAYRRLQDALADYGFSRLKQEAFFPNVAATLNLDPGSQVAFNWISYFNGAVQTSPVLPQDMASPLKLWERRTSSGGIYYPMDQVLNGMPSAPKQNLNRVWEWREEVIFLPGATVATDIRMRYEAYLTDFMDNAPLAATPWYNQKVPIMRALNPLSWLICSETAKARGDLDGNYFDSMATMSIRQVWDRDPAQARSIDKPSEYGKMQVPSTPPDGPASRAGA